MLKALLKFLTGNGSAAKSAETGNGKTGSQVDVELLQTATHLSKNTPSDHLFKFYQIFQDIRDQYFDGMIITGAPVEQMEFEQVSYWQELCTIMEWSKTHVHSTLHICWGAQAALHYHAKDPTAAKTVRCLPAHSGR